MIRTLTFVCVAFLLTSGFCRTADAGWGQHGSIKGRVAARQAATMPWHGYHYKPEWGMPLALVAPPTAEAQTHWGWGVGNTRITPIRHQYHRNWAGPGVYSRRAYRPTPPWPSDTDQMGVYYIRGPW